LGFSIATTLKPDILLLDEVLAVGDTAFRAKCFERIGKILSGTSVIFVSHDENQIARICDRVVVLDRGVVQYEGPTQQGLRLYRQKNEIKVSSQHITSPLIFGVELSVMTPAVAWGGDLVLLLRFNAKEEIDLGLFLVHISAEGTFVSHADLTTQCKKISAGLNEWRITLKALQLVEGSCYASIAIFSEDRRVTLVHLINAAKFQMAGDKGYGPTVMQSAYIEVLAK
jgi:lipopolysaccharide transport system ATP-binding protein